MIINWLSSEETELLVKAEDLPNFLLHTDAQETFSTGIQCANHFIKELQRALVAKKTDELLYLYDTKFNKYSELYFKTVMWPSVEEIEKEDEDLEVQINTFFLYNELMFRHAYGIFTNNFPPEVRINTFKNYSDFFNQIAASKEDDLAVPSQWIWDMLNEFLYQYQDFCQFRARIKEETDPSYQYYLENIDEIWTFNRVADILNNFVKNSKIAQKGAAASSGIPKVLQYFGYFSLVILSRLYTLVCDYSASIKAIEPIDFNDLQIYTKSFHGFISLFYNAGFCFLMQKRYKESVKLLEFMLRCYFKYKQFYSKSFQFENMNKLADKSLTLLSLGLLFYPTAIDENISAALAKKGDKLEKLNKYDLSVFGEFFNHSSPRYIIAIKDTEQFKTLGFDQVYGDLAAQQKESLLTDLQEAQQLNNLPGVLRLYSSIKVVKLAKLMKVTEAELKELLKKYLERNKSPTGSSPFESTIVRKLADSIPKIELVIEEDNIHIKEAVTKTNFAKIFSRNMQKIDEIIQELDKM